MKKLIITGLILGTLAYSSYAMSGMECDGKATASHNPFVKELQLEPERAARLEAVLSSYQDIGKLYSSQQSDKIPAFLAEKELELAAILTPEELAQFKQSVGEWVADKQFNFMKFAQKH